jgi:hypothetical protein
VSTQLQKLDPRYTVSLVGFDNFGAAAAISDATASGFTVTGVFRDAADFAVLMLYDADDFWGHPRLKYLPDFDLSGQTLSFDVTYTGLQPIDSAKFPTIDWAYLDVIKPDGTTAQVTLFANATQAGGSYLAADAVVTVTAAPAVAFDRVTLWYENFAFDYVATGGETAATVASALAAQINSASWGGGQAITATAVGGQITVSAAKPGVDGNMITLYAQSKTATLTLSPDVIPLSGGSSSATWNISLNFTALGIDSVRQMWLTLAPPLQDAAAYTGNEWSAVFTNWAVTDTNGNRPLKVAGPGSVRIEETDAWCAFQGSWATVSGFYSKAFAQGSSTIGDSVTVNYWCQSAHNLYLGTGLFTDRGVFGVSVDGAPETTIDTYLNTTSEVVARRLIQADVPAGHHTVKLTVETADLASSGNLCVFDFLEAAVLSDVPDAPGPWTNRMPAVDYDTDHGYRLPPARVMWMLTQLGFQGEIDLYIGVFWWMQKTRSGGSVPSLTIDFSQTTYSAGGGFGDGDQVFLEISTATYGKTVFPADDAASIAAHFCYFINEIAAGVWASVSGTVLTITLRAVGPAYNFTFNAYKQTTIPSTVPLTYSGSLEGGTLSTWVINTTETPPLNVAVRTWLADFYAQAQAAGVNVATAYSMELCYPPDAWVSQFPDGSLVQTATGFGTVNSSQCFPDPANASGFLAYQQAVFTATAQLMSAAGVPIILQCGEFLWWYFADAFGMAYYDAVTSAAATASLGRALHVFLTPNDDPSVNGYADANFLRNRLRDHVAAIVSAVQGVYPSAQFEVLYPYDVNYPAPSGAFGVGGALNNYVNTPPEWQHPGTLQRIKIEALDRGTSSRNLDLAKTAIQLATVTWSWPAAAARYLYPVDNGGCPWEREQLAAEAQGLAGLTPFALDHVSLFGWPVADPVIEPEAQIFVAT